MELLLMVGIGIWLAVAVRYSWRHRGGCNGNCSHDCRRCAGHMTDGEK